ncbi:ChrR family anti-sigma-E factor [Paraglaciecola arctica]|uniref:ChrR family anti-sigma-E factor n=1 Tax=Paraglaciecola arctica TaxID=1128911 RepID=UPI001C07B77A|nr:ChrR family anti-sigma-E factor [Paraglaciecola arctica]MBU3003590.1 ChrR family anti-sigma-E factor [Paraglaciecola arctica]
MISFHPNFADLQRFSAGNCETAMALMISAHVDMCPQCQQDCIEIQAELAKELFSPQTVIEPLDSQYLDMVSKITELPIVDNLESIANNATIELDGKFFELPRALRKYAKNTGNWSRLVGKLWQAPVDLGDIGKANFIYMEKGGRVPEHTHKGTEMTLVIDGQYGDGIAEYDCGDFTLMNNRHKHLPHSEADDGCLVFTIVDQPLHFTAGIARLLNPFSHLFFK